IKKRIEEIIHRIGEGLVDRRELVGMVLLSAVAGESIFMLGPPGVGKSMVARRVKFAFKEGSSFEYLMNRFSTPDEIFGPISISRLSKEDKYERLTENYLPGASVVFLDEIWKAGPSIQNALLTVINEKLYRNGEQEVKVKLQGLVGASNELPAKDEGLEALWDRFLVRYYVDRIMNEEHFYRMITSTPSDKVSIDPGMTISESEIEAWSKDIDKVTVPEEVLFVISTVRKLIEQHNEHLTAEGKEKEILYVSDRRWRKIIRLLRTSAFLNGHKKVDMMDCFIISFCIWSTPEQIDQVRRWVGQAICEYGLDHSYHISAVEDQINAFKQEALSGAQEEKLIQVEQPVLVDDQYYLLTEFSESHKYIRKKDFEKLKGKVTECPLYTSWGDSKYYHLARLSDCEVEVSFENGYQYFKLKSRQEQQLRTVPKRPSDEVFDKLNQLSEDILRYLNETASSIEKQRLRFRNHLDDHLFVSAENHHLIENGLNELLRRILHGKLNVEQIKGQYTYAV
ncbi:AAA family ATPase, partial [Xanthovirga aplysinae]|uniref:AAA family ATPase n=1 Tax=Xanthovirga aplysinae TaxID=2529853 RepID=UPI0012BC3AD2